MNCYLVKSVVTEETAWLLEPQGIVLKGLKHFLFI